MKRENGAGGGPLRSIEIGVLALARSFFYRIQQWIVKMSSNRGPLRSIETHMKSTSSSFKQERNQGSALMHVQKVEVDFVPHLPRQKQLLTLTIRKDQDGGRKWGLARANALEPSIRIGIYSKSWFRRLSEAFGGGRGGYLGDKTDLASQTWPAGAPGGACAKPPGSIFEDFGGLLGRFSELS